MQFMSTKFRSQNHREGGFTLIEMLIVAPMIILLIAASIAAITSLTGQSIILQARNEMDYNLQNALNDIENDAIKATAFLQTSGTLTSPQGSDNNFAGTAAFTSSSSLIIGVLGTNKNPLDPTHQIIYYAKQPNDCASAGVQANRTFIGKVIYYVYNGSLWRRSIVPNYNTNATVDDYTTCSAPWQRNSCSPGYTAALCKTEDTEELKNVSSFGVQYYASPDSTSALTAANARQAQTIVVTINGSQMVAGQAVTSTGSTRVTRLNDIDADLTAPSSAPTVTYSLNATQAVTFSWGAIPNATSYQVSYVQNGVTTNVGNIPGTSYTILTTRKDNITFNVAARNYQGTSSITSTSITIPSVAPCPLQNNWVPYGAPYGTATFTRTSAKVVVLGGLIKNGTGVQQEVICNLPVGYRPDVETLFSVATFNGERARVDVRPNGDVVFFWGNTGWISLDGISFVASGSYTWTNLTASGTWGPYGSPYAPPKVTKDPSGRAFLEGLAKNSVNPAASSAAYSLPSGYATDNNILFAAGGPDGVVGSAQLGSTINYRYSANSYWSLQAMYYPTGSTTWTTPTLGSSWVTYSASWATAQYTKNTDNIVSLRGLIKGGTTTNGTVIFTLPAGYRPSVNIICSELTQIISPASDGFARVDVATNGQVIVREGSYVATGWLSLSGCNFIAEQ